MNASEKRLYRSTSNRMAFGVCGGLADYFGVDATLIRLGFVAGVIFGFGSFLVLYLVMFFIVPQEPVVPPPTE
jgi:phage shock protein C